MSADRGCWSAPDPDVSSNRHNLEHTPPSWAHSMIAGDKCEAVPRWLLGYSLAFRCLGSGYHCLLAQQEVCRQKNKKPHHRLPSLVGRCGSPGCLHQLRALHGTCLAGHHLGRIKSSGHLLGKKQNRNRNHRHPNVISKVSCCRLSTLPTDPSNRDTSFQSRHPPRPI